MRKIAVVTTFNEAGLKKYGQNMIDTFSSTWPAEIKLYVYPEECSPIINRNNSTVTELTSITDLMRFKNKWKHVPKANGDILDDPIRNKRKDATKKFKWDAIRFSHKVYAIFDCAKNTDADVLIWMDADTICHSPISLEAINKLIPINKDICFLGRKDKFTECGLYSMNLRSPLVINFLEKFQQFYDNAENGIFTLAEWHDSFVFDAVRKQCTLNELDWSSHIITGEGHPLINSEWGAYLDHLKGDRKTAGKSKRTDLKVKRTEKYWTVV